MPYHQNFVFRVPNETKDINVKALIRRQIQMS